jgi:hypothetical protein
MIGDKYTASGQAWVTPQGKASRTAFADEVFAQIYHCKTGEDIEKAHGYTSTGGWWSLVAQSFTDDTFLPQGDYKVRLTHCYPLGSARGSTNQSMASVVIYFYLTPTETSYNIGLTGSYKGHERGVWLVENAGSALPADFS